jgi:serine/threonine protein kinase
MKIFLFFIQVVILPLTIESKIVVEITPVYSKYIQYLNKSLWQHGYDEIKAFEFRVYLSKIIKELNKNGFQIEKELGKGNFGIVFEGKTHENIKIVIKITSAITTVHYYNIVNSRNCFININISKCMKHENKQLIPYEVAVMIRARDIDGVIKILGFGRVILDNNMLGFHIIIMQHISGSMSVQEFSRCIRTRKENKPESSYKFFKSILKQFYEINKKLYEIKIYHNDLKNDNALVTYTSSNKMIGNECNKIGFNGTLKVYLIDFGIAYMGDSNWENFEMAPNYEYFNLNKAPELFIINNPISVNKLLSWYHGTFLFELLNGRHIFSHFNRYNFNFRINQHIVDNIVKASSKFVSSMIGVANLKNVEYFYYRTLKVNPTKRCSFSDLAVLFN